MCILATGGAVSVCQSASRRRGSTPRVMRRATTSPSLRLSPQRAIRELLSLLLQRRVLQRGATVHSSRQRLLLLPASARSLDGSPCDLRRLSRRPCCQAV